MTAIGLLLFCGTVGKSGQLPLHVWLPDAMEGTHPGVGLDPCRDYGGGWRIPFVPYWIFDDG